MERKSIGSLIAALRRTGGMTQKELAEKLSVSDKAISRWEREESLPDLMLLPVIADIFHITVDELLRGECKPAQREEAAAASTADGERLKKQTRRMLALQMNKLRGRFCMAFCVAALGLIAALICNFGFSRGFVGFCIGTVCIAAAAVMTAAFTQGAWQAADDEDFDAESVCGFRIKVIKWCKWMAIALTVMLCFCLPMAASLYGTAQGFVDVFLDPGQWIKYSVICLAVLCTALSAALFYIDKRFLSTKYVGNENNHRLHGWTISVLCCVMAGTLIAMTLVPEAAVTARMNGERFDNVEEFVAEMERRWAEQEKNGGYQSFGGSAVEYIGTYYDHEGNEISREDMALNQVCDLDGNVIAEYHCPYDTRVVITYYDDEISIVCYTDGDMRRASNEREMKITLLLLAFVTEPLLSLGIYQLLRKGNREK